MRITLAIPEGKKGIPTFIKKELSSAKNIKSKETRDQVIKGLRRIQMLDKASRVVLYYDGETDELTNEVYKGTDFIYHCGKVFVRPEPPKKGKFILVALDSKECTIGMMEGKKITTLWHETSGVMGKHGKGGQSKERFARGREEALKQWYKTVAGKLQEIVMGRGDD